MLLAKPELRQTFQTRCGHSDVACYLRSSLDGLGNTHGCSLEEYRQAKGYLNLMKPPPTQIFPARLVIRLFLSIKWRYVLISEVSAKNIGRFIILLNTNIVREPAYGTIPSPKELLNFWEAIYSYSLGVPQIRNCVKNTNADGNIENHFFFTNTNQFQ